MRTHKVRFGSQWALVGVIVFYAVGTALISWHTKTIFKPALANSHEFAAMPEMPEPSFPEHWQYSTSGLINLIKSGQNAADLRLSFHAFGAEQFSNTSVNAEIPLSRNIEEPDDIASTSTPAKQVLTRVQTKIKCVKTVLKKAVIEPCYINGQIVGLRITGLDKILAARDLLLKSGDIISAVNGHPLNSKQQAYEIFKKARSKPFMIVNLLRDGEVQELLFEFR